MSKSLEQLFAAFLYESEFVRKVRPETLRGYSSTFNLFMKIQSGTTLQSLDSATMISFFRTLQERRRTVGKGLVKEGVKNQPLQPIIQSSIVSLPGLHIIIIFK